MKLIATYSFHYGRKGAHDQEYPLLSCGEEFTPVATAMASADEAGKHLIRRGAAVTPEVWASKGQRILAAHQASAARCAAARAKGNRNG